MARACVEIDLLKTQCVRVWVVVEGPGLLVLIEARRTHQLGDALKRRGMAAIGLLLIAAVPAAWMLMGEHGLSQC